VAYLVINTEGKPPVRKTLDGPAIVGRARRSDVSIDDHRLSRSHCRFEPTANDGWAVIDLNSTNGTQVAGALVGYEELSDGDEIIVGRSRIIFHARAAPPVRPAKPTRDADLGLPSSGASAAGIPSPGDTLVDSRFPVPRIDPAGAQQRSEAKTVIGRGGAAPAAAHSIKRSLAFRRPPARPQVAGARPSGFLRSLWQKLTGRNA